MSVYVTLECGGCFAKTEPTLMQVQTRVLARMPGGHIVERRQQTPQDVAPEGWIAYDPYTHCTYCPSCWASIEEGSP